MWNSFFFWFFIATMDVETIYIYKILIRISTEEYKIRTYTVKYSTYSDENWAIVMRPNCVWFVLWHCILMLIQFLVIVWNQLKIKFQIKNTHTQTTFVYHFYHPSHSLLCQDSNQCFMNLMVYGVLNIFISRWRQHFIRRIWHSE